MSRRSGLDDYLFLDRIIRSMVADFTHRSCVKAFLVVAVLLFCCFRRLTSDAVEGEGGVFSNSNQTKSARGQRPATSL